MSFFPDLTPYTYLHSDEPGAVNVGWLDAEHPYPTGRTSNAFRAKLAKLCERPVQQTRGFHQCPFCKGPDRPLSSAEMRVAGGDRVYAAPLLVHHYVVAHDYRPPDEFIAAVLAAEPGSN
jgi:hypothetical protein